MQTSFLLSKILYSLFKLSNDSTATNNLGISIKKNIAVVLVERDKTVASEFLEISVTVKHEDSKLANLNSVNVLNEHNVAVMILGLHTVTVNTKRKVCNSRLFILGNHDLLSFRVIKVNACTCGYGKIIQKYAALCKS